MNAAERREAVLRAAVAEFARQGYHGTSTEAIARRVGVSQPYPFRLYHAFGEAIRAGWTRLWETVHAPLRADVDETSAFLARGMLLNALTVMGFPPEHRVWQWIASTDAMAQCAWPTRPRAEPTRTCAPPKPSPGAEPSASVSSSPRKPASTGWSAVDFETPNTRATRGAPSPPSEWADLAFAAVYDDRAAGIALGDRLRRRPVPVQGDDHHAMAVLLTDTDGDHPAATEPLAADLRLEGVQILRHVLPSPSFRTADRCCQALAGSLGVYEPPPCPPCPGPP
ncbi:hypothetical protein GCM10010260_38960 [Streptomyces filipinensis]|uniref:HTH tetR-type domain-containing protein n=1 Tax=Streptomyces filipinensis TaxID=66887 RepID=A0A918MC75_9ACTN|nr:hypothetical protein GCM10010260_38960 [Streptomyces filipinensis]